MVTGQPVLLPSGQDGLLVELKDGSHAVLVSGPGKRAMVVKETSKGKRTELSLSSLKDGEEVAKLAAGQGRGEAVSGTEVMSQVIIVLKDENMARQIRTRYTTRMFRPWWVSFSVRLVTNCMFRYVSGVACFLFVASCMFLYQQVSSSGLVAS